MENKMYGIDKFGKIQLQSLKREAIEIDRSVIRDPGRSIMDGCGCIISNIPCGR